MSVSVGLTARDLSVGIVGDHLALKLIVCIPGLCPDQAGFVIGEHLAMELPHTIESLPDFLTTLVIPYGGAMAFTSLIRGLFAHLAIAMVEIHDIILESSPVAHPGTQLSFQIHETFAVQLAVLVVCLLGHHAAVVVDDRSPV